MRRLHIFGGSTHDVLITGICEHLGLRPGPISLSTLSNSETHVTLGSSVRNSDVYIVQTVGNRANDALMELFSAVHASKGASSQRVTAVLPLFPYSRHAGAARALIPRLFASAGCDHIITMDLHDPQFLGFFDIPVDNIVSRGLFQKYIQRHIPDYRNAVIVSPDAGGAKRATVIANTLGMDFALVHKV